MLRSLGVTVVTALTIVSTIRAGAQSNTGADAAATPHRDTLASAAPVRPKRPSVRVSSREVRIAFPVDTSAAWGWPISPSSANRYGYGWYLSVSGMDSPKSIWFTVSRDSTARAFTSFADLVRAGRAELCQGGVVVYCDGSWTSAFMHRDTLVIVFRDPAQIRRLFGLRPAARAYSVQRPEGPYDAGQDSVRIEYVAPLIPEPTAATRAEFGRARRRYEASINSYSRGIAIGDDWSHSPDRAWLQVGDSLAARVTETHCVYDACSESRTPPSDSGWSIADSGVARLQPPDTSARFLRYVARNTRYYVKALRPGRTVLSVRGLHGSAATAVSERRPEHNLQRTLVVTVPVTRIRFVTKRNTARVNEPFTLDVRAYDAAGRVVPDVPTEIVYQRGDVTVVGLPGASMVIDTAGVARLVARARALSDTTTVVVVDSSARRR